MKYRRLGKTDLLVSEIGFGAWGIGGTTAGATSYGPTNDVVSRKALDCAFEEGINFFDTSNVYGDGHSEALIGQAFKKKRSQVLIATKVGLVKYGQATNFSIKNLSSSFEASLKRLQTDYVDILQLHNPSLDSIEPIHKIHAWIDQLKNQGKVRAFGVSVRSPADGLWVIDKLKVQSLQVNFNLLDHRAIDSGLLKSSAQNQVSLIARTPLCFGFLSGRLSKNTRFDKLDHRSRWPSQQINNWAKSSRKMLSYKTNSPYQTNTQFALRFCLSYPQIVTAIPGILNEKEVKENIIASDIGSLRTNQIMEIQKAYQKVRFLIEDDSFKNIQSQDLGKIDNYHKK